MTGEAKIQGAIAYVQDALEGSSEQVLVFAHHQAVLDAMEQAMNRAKTKYIRIDGSTPTQERHRLGTSLVMGGGWCESIHCLLESISQHIRSFCLFPNLQPPTNNAQSNSTRRTPATAAPSSP